MLYGPLVTLWLSNFQLVSVLLFLPLSSWWLYQINQKDCLSHAYSPVQLVKKLWYFSWWVFKVRNGKEVAKGKLHKLTARENYTQYLTFVLKYDINLRETGLIIQLNLFWLAASPDGLVSDHSDSRKVGLIEIKCPKLECNYTQQ